MRRSINWWWRWPTGSIALCHDRLNKLAVCITIPLCSTTRVCRDTLIEPCLGLADISRPDINGLHRPPIVKRVIGARFLYLRRQAAAAPTSGTLRRGPGSVRSGVFFTCETPMARDPGKSSPSNPGEAVFLDWVRRRQAHRRQVGLYPRLLTPAGDDLAVLAPTAGQILLGMDPVLDGVHVELSAHGPTAMGRKALNRNLSDVAAMAGTPVAAVLSIILSRDLTLETAKGIYEGAEQAGDAFDCPVAGGDFASWAGKTVATVAILATADPPVLRGHPRPGDGLWVTGPLGGSILGRHLTAAPRLKEARMIQDNCKPSAMLDLSDGLSRDLPRLVGDTAGATLDASAIPVHEDARQLAGNSRKEPLWHALHDGEDYELLFAAESCELPGCVRVGSIDREPGVWLRRGERVEPLEALGWEHQVGKRKGVRRNG